DVIRAWVSTVQDRSRSDRIDDRIGLKCQTGLKWFGPVRVGPELNNRNVMEISQKAKIRWSIECDENFKYFHDQVQDLERTVTYEEVKMAVYDCGTNKSPGPDEFSFKFYPLISKIQDAKFVKDSLPISLIGSVYKIIAKILANRLCVVLPYLISDVQSDFVANRQILDGSFILNELLSCCKFKKLNGMIFKVDFEKAFDSVKWDYLDETLKAFGFGSKWRNWISGCLNNAMGSVLVNGSPTLEFQFHKGLKQGDLISPFYLFILIMETLRLTFKRVLNVGLYKDISLNDSFTISHLFYADDMVFIGEWNNNNIQTLLSVLRLVATCQELPRGTMLSLRMPRGGVEQKNYGLLCSKVVDLILPNILDIWCWSLEGSQEFSVKASRILVDNTILSKAEVPTRWLRVVPIKAMKSSSHIFFACPLARQVWRQFLICWELEDMAFNSYNEWLNWIVNIRLHKQLKVFLEALHNHRTFPRSTATNNCCPNLRRRRHPPPTTVVVVLFLLQILLLFFRNTKMRFGFILVRGDRSDLVLFSLMTAEKDMGGW
nr:RNA-directed DNA polymerase, eukaryota [Tanacetum cinerariifolium]